MSPRPYPNFASQLANTLALLQTTHHKDANALIAAHLERIEQPELPAQLLLPEFVPSTTTSGT